MDLRALPRTRTRQPPQVLRVNSAQLLERVALVPAEIDDVGPLVLLGPRHRLRVGSDDRHRGLGLVFAPVEVAGNSDTGELLQCRIDRSNGRNLYGRVLHPAHAMGMTQAFA